MSTLSNDSHKNAHYNIDLETKKKKKEEKIGSGRVWIGRNATYRQKERGRVAYMVFIRD